MNTRWRIDKSYKVRMPDYLECKDLEELRQSLQDLADTYVATEDHPSLGELEFRYELDRQEQISTVHVYFYNKHRDRSRFAKVNRAC